MITKDQIIKALYNSAKKTETTEGIEMNFVFADQADAILNLLQGDVSGLACKCGNQTFTHRHSNWIECTACNKIQVLQACR